MRLPVSVKTIGAAIFALAILGTVPGSAQAANGTFCAKYASGNDVVLLLVDRTSNGRPDRLRAAAAEARQYLLGQLVGDDLRPDRKKMAGGALRSGQRLELSSIMDNVANRQVFFNDCRPGREASFKSLLEKPLDPTALGQYDLDYSTEITTVLDKALAKAVSARQSAIIDTLSKVTGEYPPGTIKRVVIVSDMLDNLTVNLLPTNGKTRGLTEFQLQEALRTVAVKNAFAQVKGAEVVVFGFGVDDADRTPLHPDASRMVTRFWEAYFQRSDAKGLTIKY
jgi:hypothetical protein